MPVRIQRKRSKGWRMPEGAVYVGRPTKWGNPFTIEDFGRADAVNYFRDCAEHRHSGPWQTYPQLHDIVRELRGKDLACWCPLDKPCHADVLLEIANK